MEDGHGVHPASKTCDLNMPTQQSTSDFCAKHRDSLIYFSHLLEPMKISYIIDSHCSTHNKLSPIAQPCVTTTATSISITSNSANFLNKPHQPHQSQHPPQPHLEPYKTHVKVPLIACHHPPHVFRRPNRRARRPPSLARIPSRPAPQTPQGLRQRRPVCHRSADRRPRLARKRRSSLHTSQYSSSPPQHAW